jgi:nitrogenase molybdenum-iron protein alpha/beta subunit
VQCTDQAEIAKLKIPEHRLIKDENGKLLGFRGCREVLDDVTKAFENGLAAIEDPVAAAENEKEVERLKSELAKAKSSDIHSELEQVKAERARLLEEVNRYKQAVKR